MDRTAQEFRNVSDSLLHNLTELKGLWIRVSNFGTIATGMKTPDIQKVLTFEGAFEKLFNIVRERGVEGGAVAHEALICVDNLCSLTRPTKNWTATSSSLPAAFPAKYPTPQEFALQFWDDQKLVNALAIVAIIGLLIGSKGYGLIITPYMPIPETNGKEWDWLEAASALDALVELALNEEYNGQESARRLMTGLELRTAAVGVFKNLLGGKKSNTLLYQQWLFPKELTRHSFRQHLSFKRSQSGGGSFFVPANGPALEPTPTAHEEDDDPPQTLLQILAEHLSLVLLSRSKTDTPNLELRE
ncbi:hypothetical protein BT96DRAFT_980295 [Gymnopus androsaceus JB14]|uniref:Uncharacterized protein n=1 Tax=Gymnopus androsaceus JB14 TaxID=1447944 RepID=A0A6A4GZH2_9AGAR|nr:hypothetical protein BT96DRAFT_980295 [Gymnopus androsaceus JB14]